MKMKTDNLFPLVEPDHKFREQLKFEVLKVYNRQRQPRFNWRWLAAPGFALVSLLLVVLSGKGQMFTDLNPPNKLQPNQIIENFQQAQQQNSDQQTQLAEKSQNLDQLDQELTELSNILDADSDLEAAIAFDNL